MSELQQRIDDLVHAGQVSPAEGRALTEAAGTRAPGWSRWFDPFSRLSTGVGLAVAFSGLAAQLAVSQLGVRFDGALDMHLVPEAPSWSVVFADAAVSLPLLALVLWLSSWGAGKRPRLVDSLWTTGVARWPLVASGLVRLHATDPAASTEKLTRGEIPSGMAITLLIVLPLVALFFYWLYKAYRTASGLSGRRAGVSFALAVVVVEVASKWLLASLGVWGAAG